MDTLKGSIATIVGSVAFGIIMLTQFPPHLLTKTIMPGMGNPVTETSAYENWKQQKQMVNENDTIRMPLKMLNDKLNHRQSVKGVAVINISEGKLEVDITGLDAKNTYQAWLIYADSYSNEQVLPLGELTLTNGHALLTSLLTTEALFDAAIKRIVITKNHQHPLKEGFLSSSPVLFQQVYRNEQRLLADASVLTRVSYRGARNAG